MCQRPLALPPASFCTSPSCTTWNAVPHITTNLHPAAERSCWDCSRGRAMTEAQWLTCGLPHVMLQFVGKRAGQRRSRLLICGYTRSHPDAFMSEELAHAVKAAEACADGFFSHDELKASRS